MRGTLLAIALVLPLGAIPLGAQCPDGTPPPCSHRVVPPDTNLLVILPFRVNGPPATRYIGVGIASLLTYALDDFGGWRIASTGDVAPPQAKADIRPLARAALARGATRLIVGEATTLGSQLRVYAGLYDTRTGRRLMVAQAAASLERPEPAVDTIAAVFGRDRMRGGSGTPRPAAEILTGSPVALRHFLVGERLRLQRRFQEAMDTLLAAIAEDSGFGMAYYAMYLASTQGGLNTHGWDGLRIAREALRHADRIPPRTRRLLEVVLAQEEGQGPRALQRAEELADDYPRDADAAALLADATFHFGLSDGVPAERARARFERALALDSTLAEMTKHHLQIQAMLGDTVDLWAGLDRRSSLGRAARMLLGGADPVTEARSLGTAVDGAFMDDVIHMLLLVGDRDPVRALAMADAYTEAVANRADLSTQVHFVALRRRAEVLVARGLDRTARELLQEVAAMRPPGFDLRPRIAFDLVRPAETWGAAGAVEVFEAYPVTQRNFVIEELLAWYSAVKGPAERFAEHERVMDTLYLRPAQPAFLRLRMEGVRGLADLSRGDSSGARARLSAAWEGQPYFRSSPYESMMLGVQALALARLEAASGAPAQALTRLYRTSWMGFVCRAEAEELRGMLFERLGDTASAIRADRNFVALWEHADPELQPRVQRARDALTRLERR